MPFDNDAFEKLVGDLCRAYGKLTRSSDQIAMRSMFCLLGIYPIVNVPPNLLNSLNTFRRLSNAESYQILLGIFNSTIIEPSRNPNIQALSEHSYIRNAKIQAPDGSAFVESGTIFFPFGETSNLDKVLFGLEE